MFDTYEEASDLNSDCSFCGKSKFSIVGISRPKDVVKYDLERCSDPECTIHCQWGHSMSLEILEVSEDRVSIASGWGTH